MQTAVSLGGHCRREPAALVEAERRQRKFLVDEIVGEVVADLQALRLVVARGPWLDPVHRLVQLCGIVCEALCNPAAGGENSRARACVERLVQVVVGGLPRLQQIARLHMDVVEEISDVAVREFWLGRCGGRLGGVPRNGRRCRRRGRGAGLDRELGDDLRLAFIEELEILLPQATHRPALTIADHHRHGDQVDAAAERRRSFRAKPPQVRLWREPEPRRGMNRRPSGTEPISAGSWAVLPRGAS